MTGYHLSGALNASLFVLSLLGLGAQLQAIGRRRGARATFRGYATDLLSLNYFSVSFLAYFAFFVYGYAITPFNHYLVWPRLMGCMLVLAVLVEMARDRRSRLATGAAAVATLGLVGGVWLLVSGVRLGAVARFGPQLLSVVAAGFVSQSLVHQIRLVRRASQRGAVSLALHVSTLLKDLSTVVFGLAMGLALGWPLMLMGGVSAGLKLVLLWQLHRVGALRRPAAR